MYFRSLKRKPAPLWKERFGTYPLPPHKGRRRIWLHAVSVGEFLAAVPILDEIRSQFPNHDLVLSCTTSSGHQTAEQTNHKRIEEGKIPLFDHLIYFPIDVARITLSALQQVRPEVVVIMETELWFNFLWAAKVFDSRVMIVNGRISDRSFPRMMKLNWFYRSMLKDIDRALMQSQTDANRLKELGFEAPEVAGNCKFEQALPPKNANPDLARTLFAIPKNQLLIIVGSTRSELEENLVLSALTSLRNQIQVPFTVIHAPRHLERAPFILTLAEKQGFHAQLRTALSTAENATDVNYWVLDSYGELANMYGGCDIAVVGGGFDRLGGQNILQPLGWGKPVIHGPNMQNFADASALAMRAGATLVCATAEELADSLSQLINNPPQREKMGESARQLVADNLGAVQRFSIALKQEIAKFESIRKDQEMRRKKRIEQNTRK